MLSLGKSFENGHDFLLCSNFWHNSPQETGESLNRETNEKREKWAPEPDLDETQYSGAMASLSASWLVMNKLVDSHLIRMITFGQPRTGNKEYADAHDKMASF